MEHNISLIHGAYAAAGVIALVVYLGLPKQGQPTRGGLLLLVSAFGVGALVLLLGQVLGDQAAGRAYFYVLSSLAVIGGIRVITHAKPVYSALYFLLVALSTAALLVLAGAEYLAVALVIVYAGAILVTYIFVIMMVRQSASAYDYDRSAREPAAAVFVGFVLIATVAGVIVVRDGLHGGEKNANDARQGVCFSETPPPGTSVRGLVPTALTSAETATQAGTEAEGNTMQIAKALFLEDGFPISFQAAGILLVIAMVGAIVIVRKRLPRAAEETKALPLGEIGKHVKPF